jgi:hypothetical protein
VKITPQNIHQRPQQPIPEVVLGSNNGKKPDSPTTTGGNTNNPDYTPLLQAKMTSEFTVKKCRPGEVFSIDVKMTNTGTVNWPPATTFCR